MASTPLILLSIPGLRRGDLDSMPRLQSLGAGGGLAELVPSFPAVTCPVQANMTTGTLPCEHGVVANGFYWRDQRRIEMWTAGNECILRPQIWDRLTEHDANLTSAVWFPLHSKRSSAALVCTPAPIHNPDGTESLWCYTRPESMYGELRDVLGHFPLQHFWGPAANIQSTAWIVDSAVWAAERHRPDFFYIYLYDPAPLCWIVASEYAIVPVHDVTYPNRVLREAGLLSVRPTDHGELIDLETSRAWALVDHQASHVFLNATEAALAEQVARLFRGEPGIAEVVSGESLARRGLDHPRSGELVLVSTPESWQAYYYWLDDRNAPDFARTVDIHRKPGYDPVELHVDPLTRSIPLDATLVAGSHGAPAEHPAQRGILLSSDEAMIPTETARDTDVAAAVLRHFGVPGPADG
jgi:hypothetical protein